MFVIANIALILAGVSCIVFGLGTYYEVLKPSAVLTAGLRAACVGGILALGVLPFALAWGAAEEWGNLFTNKA